MTIKPTLGQRFKLGLTAAFGGTWNTRDSDGWSFWGGGAPSKSGIRVNEMNALSVSSVWACVSLLANTVGVFPINLYQDNDDGTSVLVKGHPVVDLLSEPNPAFGKSVIFNTTELQRNLWGNGYIQVERRGKNPVRLWALDSSCTAPYCAPTSRGIDFYATNFGGQSQQLAPEDVIHVRRPSPDARIGLNAIWLARETLGMAIAAEQFGSEFFKNEAKSGGVLVHPGKLSPTAKKNIKTSFEEQAISAATKEKESHGVKVLEEGMKFIPTTISPDESQFNMTREFLITEVARMYGVPLMLLQSIQGSTVWGTGIEQLMIGFVTLTLKPIVEQYEEELTRKLLTMEERLDGYRIRLDLNSLLRGDQTARAAYIASGIQNQWLTDDEARQMEGRNPFTPAQRKQIADAQPKPAAPAQAAPKEPAQ